MTSPKSKTVGRVAALGLIWATLSAALSKIASVGGQLALGHLLDPSIYGVFAVASVAVGLISGLQTSAISKSLIQRRDEIDDLIPSYTSFSLIVSLLAGVGLIVVGATLADVYSMPDLPGILAVSAISAPFLALNGVQMAQLGAKMRFRSIAALDAGYATIYALSTVAFASLGAQSYSISLGTLASAIAIFCVNLHFTGKIRFAPVSEWRRIIRVGIDVRWLLVASVLFSLTQQGDYLTLGLVLTTYQLGVYYFGYMLTANVGTLLSLAIGKTLMPVFSSIQTDVQELRHHYQRITKAITFACGVLCLGMIGMASTIVHFLWQGKWDAAVMVAVVMAISFPTRILASLAATVIEARAKWALRAYLLGFDGFGIIAAAGVGGAIAGLFGAAVGVGIHRALTGVVCYVFAALEIDMKPVHALKSVAILQAPFLVVAIILIIMEHYVVQYIGSLTPIINTFLAVVLFSVLNTAMNRDGVADILARFRAQRSRVRIDTGADT